MIEQNAAQPPSDVTERLKQAVGEGGYELQTSETIEYGATVVRIHLTGTPPHGFPVDTPIRLPLGISREQAEQTWRAEVDRFAKSYQFALEQATAPGTPGYVPGSATRQSDASSIPVASSTPSTTTDTTSGEPSNSALTSSDSDAHAAALASTDAEQHDGEGDTARKSRRR